MDANDLDNLTILILALDQIKGVGPQTVLKVFNQVREPQRLLTDFGRFHMINIPVFKRILRAGQFNQQQWQEDIIQAHEIFDKTRAAGIDLINYQMPDYPQNMVVLKSFPLIIYTKGNRALLNEPSVGFIGTRRPTTLGAKMAEHIAAQFAKDGYVIVSGLSIGTNTAAHKGALETTGKTIAVVGHSLEQPIYPKENTALAEEILAKGGLIMSPFRYGTIVRRQFLAARDEWESGISDGLVVIETDQNGKTELALQHAFKQNRPVAMLDHSQCDQIDDPMQIEQAIGNQKYIQTQQAFPLWSKESLKKFEEIMAHDRQRRMLLNKRSRGVHRISSQNLSLF